MDYEQKYKDAFKRAKTEIDNCGTNEAFREMVYAIFPELNESEDERIRKMLLDQMKRWNKMAKEEGVEQDVKDSDAAIAYLEKQKEQKPVEIHIDNPNIQKFDPDVKVTTSDSSADGKELLYVSNKSYDIGFRDGVASVKPAEWSKEDDDYLADVKSAAISYYDEGYAGELCGWLESLSPQPKQEWADRDKFMLESIIDVYSFNVESNISAFLPEKGLEKYREQLNWLKSLNPVNIFRPSKEMMIAIKDIMDEEVGTWRHLYLELLYDFLKSLQ